MLVLEIAFWSCAALVLYAYVGYPLLMGVLARVAGRPVRRGRDGPRTVSFVVCAHNEQAGIERRLRELIGILQATSIEGEIIVVSDGSTDETAAAARAFSPRAPLGREVGGEGTDMGREELPPIHVLELPRQVGKAEALSRGVALARNAIVVFADVRQVWATDALGLLLESFADPAVGAVSGDLMVVSGPGAMAGIGLYWHFEKWLRQQESKVLSQVGVTGAISAVRRELFQPIPAGTILDDVHWPLVVAMQGHRVIHDCRARAFDRLPERAGDELRRKVRTLAGNFQLVARLPGSVLPWRNPVWMQLVSHKLLRLVVPWALLGLLACSMALAAHPVYLAALVVQGSVYVLGLLSLLSGRGGRVSAAAASLLVLNAAAWLAFWVWVSGRTECSWQKVAYEELQIADCRLQIERKAEEEAPAETLAANLQSAICNLQSRS
jgi:cellulose synthase/poly-beta-1,6-N-acetylglucosamine synthase-like glycosyltransferase